MRFNRIFAPKNRSLSEKSFNLFFSTIFMLMLCAFAQVNADTTAKSAINPVKIKYLDGPPVTLVKDGKAAATIVIPKNDLKTKLYALAANMGLDFKQNVSVVGFYNTSLAEALHPTLTSISVDEPQIAHIAARIALLTAKPASG